MLTRFMLNSACATLMKYCYLLTELAHTIRPALVDVLFWKTSGDLVQEMLAPFFYLEILGFDGAVRNDHNAVARVRLGF